MVLSLVTGGGLVYTGNVWLVKAFSNSVDNIIRQGYIKGQQNVYHERSAG